MSQVKGGQLDLSGINISKLATTRKPRPNVKQRFTIAGPEIVQEAKSCAFSKILFFVLSLCASLLLIFGFANSSSSSSVLPTCQVCLLWAPHLGLDPLSRPPGFELQLNSRETLSGLFAAMGLPPLPPLKAVSDPPRVFADRFVGLPSWHAAVLLSTTHAREPNPKTTPTEP